MSGVTGVGVQNTQSSPSALDNTIANNQFVQWTKKEKVLSLMDIENRLTELLFKDMQTDLDKTKVLAILKELRDFTDYYPNSFDYFFIVMEVYIRNVLSKKIELPFSFLEEMFQLLLNSNLMNDHDLAQFKEYCWTFMLSEEYWPYLDKPKTQTAKPAQFSYYPAVSIPGYNNSAPRIVCTQEPVLEKMDHFEIFFNKKLLGFLDACKIMFDHLPLTDHEIRICNDRGETIVGKLETVFAALLKESSKTEFKLKMDKASDPIQLKKEFDDRRATIAQLSEQLKSK